MSIAEKGELLSEWRCRTGEGGVEGRIVEEKREEREGKTRKHRDFSSKPLRLDGASVYNQGRGWQRLFTPQGQELQQTSSRSEARSQVNRHQEILTTIIERGEPTGPTASNSSTAVELQL
jgi:hypothetical protein